MKLEHPPVKLRLFIAGSSPIAHRTVLRLEHAVARANGDGHDIRYEVVDVFEEPGLAEEAQVVATPLLLRTEPSPVARIVGDLTDDDAFRLLVEVPRRATARSHTARQAST